MRGDGWAPGARHPALVAGRRDPDDPPQRARIRGASARPRPFRARARRRAGRCRRTYGATGHRAVERAGRGAIGEYRGLPEDVRRRLVNPLSPTMAGPCCPGSSPTSPRPSSGPAGRCNRRTGCGPRTTRGTRWSGSWSRSAPTSPPSPRGSASPSSRPCRAGTARCAPPPRSSSRCPPPRTRSGWRVTSRQGGGRTGAGPIGLLVLAVVRAHGDRRVVVTDVLPGKRDRALALGADAVVDAGAADAADQVRAALGESADVVFDCVAVQPTSTRPSRSRTRAAPSWWSACPPAMSPCRCR
jgi:Zinc-binding dehydrogenase